MNNNKDAVKKAMAQVLGIDESQVDIGNVVETENGVKVEGIHSADVETPDDFSQKVANELRKDKAFENVHAKGNTIFDFLAAVLRPCVLRHNRRIHKIRKSLHD